MANVLKSSASLLVSASRAASSSPRSFRCRVSLPRPLPLPLHLNENKRLLLFSNCKCSSAPSEAAVEKSAAEVQSSCSDPIKDAVDTLDIRVGRIIRAWKHPEAASLYVEEVDVGEQEPRTICSGLVSYIPLEELQDKKVVVLANLKPRNMRGVKSNGMLMAASDAAHENVELLLPPDGSIAGERVWFGLEEDKDKQLDAATPNQVQKKKIWESVQPHLKTTDTCVATLGVHPMRTSAGVVVCRSLKNANIS